MRCEALCCGVLLGMLGVVPPALADGGAGPPPWLPADVYQRLKSARDLRPQGTLLQGSNLENTVVQASPAALRAATGQATYKGLRAGAADWSLVATPAGTDPCQPGLRLYQLADGTSNPCDGEQLAPAADAALTQCERDHFAAYRGLAALVPGAWGGRGTFVAATGQAQFATFSCMSGVSAKCLHWGYGPDAPGGTALYQTCTRAARADYCGSGDFFTCPGTHVDFVDARSLQRRAPGSAATELEADWDEGGAVCLAYARLPGCSAPPKMAHLKRYLATYCQAAQHKIDLTGCPAPEKCPGGSPTCGHLMRTFTVPNQSNTAGCKPSAEQCAPSPP
jgi:hypothetical protein